MNCSQIRDIIAEAFDADTITQLPGEVQQHLRHCRQCEGYYRELLELENFITAHRQIDIPEALAGAQRFEEFFAQISGGKKPATAQHHPVKPGRQKGRPSFIAGFTRIGWAVAAAVILITVSVLFLNKPAPLLINDRGNGPYLKEARLDNRPAQVIIYKTEAKYKLTVFWLYQ